MESTKAAIVAAARAVLVREGSAAFSVRKVAREAGISLGNLQYHFASRTALLTGLLVADITEYRRAYEEIRRSADRTGADGREKLRQFLVSALGDAGRHYDVATFRALFSFNEPEITTALDAYYEDLRDLLEEGLARLSGKPRQSPSVNRAVTLLFPYLDGYETTASFLPLGPTEAATLLVDIVWATLLAPA